LFILEEKDMSELTVVVTCAASLVVPSTLAALRAHSVGPYRFIGVDVSEEALASCYLDAFYQVPFPTDPGYAASLLAIVDETRAHLLLVLSDAEAVVLSEPGLRRELEGRGCLVLLPEHSVVTRCVDKGVFMGFLQEDPETAELFRLIDMPGELRECASLFGYPLVPFMVKPRIGCGSRGVLVVDAAASRFDLLFRRNYRRYTIDFLESAFEGHEHLNLLAMPLYSGGDYNIDVMCQKGKVVYSLVQQRIAPSMGAIMTAKIVAEPDIDLLVEHLVRRLQVTGLINVEVARCPRTGVPRVYEINPRPSAAFAFLCYQSVDVLGDLAQTLSGRAVCSRSFSPMWIKRVWTQLYHD
jgi:carbamoylphosphate synthase large subunit